MSSPRYYKVGPSIWLEPWDDDTRHVAFYLLTCRHRTTEGLFWLPLEYARFDVGWPAKRFDRAFRQLIQHGFIEYDDASSVVLIAKALSWQAPQNPNQITAAVKAIAELPPTCLLDRFAAIAETKSEGLAKALRERFPKGFPHSPTPTPTPTLATVTDEQPCSDASAQEGKF